MTTQLTEIDLEDIETYNRNHRGFPKGKTTSPPIGVKGLTAQIQETADCLSPVLGIPKKHILIALKVALRHISSQAHLEDRFDIIQALSIKLLDTRPPSGGFATVVCRNYVRDWNRAYMYRQHLSLDEVMGEKPPDEEAGVRHSREYLQIVGGKVEFEAKLVERLDGAKGARKLWESLNPRLRQIVLKRLRGVRLNPAERKALQRYRDAMTGVLEPAV